MIKTTPEQLDVIRSKPVVDLTPAEFACLSEREQRYVISFLAMPPAPAWTKRA